ncbi:MAG: maleylpyruvate isomerase N-terminal domain-containing protein [Mycobacterium sp.]
MNDTGVAALVDTTRDELRERTAQALQRFDRVARTADPHARPLRSNWTVQQVVSHVLTLARRYLRYAEGGYRLAAHPREVSVLNQTELEVAMAPIPELVEQLQAVVPQLDELFDEVAEEGRVLAFHCGALVDGITWQTNWLGELLLHGQDIARAVKAPWVLAERDMLLIARGLMQIGPAYVRTTLAPGTDICAAVVIPDARPYLIHIHDGVGEIRGCHREDRPDAVLRLPASTLTHLLYQRIGPFTAARKGLRVVGGRRPWLALKLQSCFEPA